MSNRPDDLLNVKQASEVLNITPRAVRHRVLAGTLTPFHKMPGATGAYLFRRAHLEHVKNAAAA